MLAPATISNLSLFPLTEGSSSHLSPSSLDFHRSESALPLVYKLRLRRADGRDASPTYGPACISFNVLPAPFHTALDLGHQGCFALRFRADQAHSVPFAPGTRRPADPVHVFDEVWCHLVLDDELDVGHIYPPGSEAGADEQTLAGGGEPVEGSLSIGGWHVWMEALGGLEARTAKHAPRLYSTGDGVGED
eukprot:CAMPEP_0181172476 /NCGR_PEP_ID=MMETSP1096-20121128/2468_1 /TAXON_ID=156174 ORGANISM="Chrysochromulina ericina, Strain CCMP281" /NCGR_SAMPLE_ID=MMETSP1096 /ASSEMBLY_ACC=CAM_ASM_000453 /LENGTH=190 /DNA_ID=CAMNT_0023260203 /DNA_START=242 /DNA_END=815 /DNA_ORIENTATION=-